MSSGNFPLESYCHKEEVAALHKAIELLSNLLNSTGPYDSLCYSDGTPGDAYSDGLYMANIGIAKRLLEECLAEPIQEPAK